VNRSFTIYAIADDGEFIVPIILQILPIFANNITGVNIHDGEDILVDERDLGVEVDRGKNYARAGEMFEVRFIYLDVFNATFANNITITVSNLDFARVVNEHGIEDPNGRFVLVRDLDLFHRFMNSNNNSFYITITMTQPGWATLTHETLIHIFVPLTRVATSFFNGSTHYVDRMHWREDVFNDMHFIFGVNGNRYSTNQRLNVELITSAQLPNVQGMFASENFSNSMRITFTTWHTAGTRFLVNLRSPDDNHIVFAFTLVIRPLNTTPDITFGTYRDSQERVQDVQVVSFGGRAGIGENRDITAYADLQAGHSVDILFNLATTRALGMGGVLEIENLTPELGRWRPGYNRITLDQADEDVFVDNSVFSLRIKLRDGNFYWYEIFHIRVFQRITADAMINFSVHQMDDTVSVNLDTALTLSELRDLRFERIITLHNSNLILDGNMLSIRANSLDHNHSFTVIFRQYYNGEVFDNIQRTFNIERRFVTTAAQLDQLRNSNRTFHLRADLNLRNWTPIAGFTGTFHGNHWWIDLHISIPTTNFASEQFFGLFGNLNGRVYNLGVIADIAGNTRNGGSWVNVGAIAGRLQSSGRITNSNTWGFIDVFRINARVGGIAGDNFGRIENSRSDVDLGVTGYAGGITGRNNASGVVHASIWVGSIHYWAEVADRSVGGAVGLNVRGGTITWTWTAGLIYFPERLEYRVFAGKIVGHHHGTFDTVNSITSVRMENNGWRNPFLGTNRGRYLGRYFDQRVGRHTR